MIIFRQLKEVINNITVPLRPTLITAVIVVIIITGMGVGVSSYRNSAKATELLWHNLSKEIADTTTDKTLDYLRTARPFLKFTEELTQIKQIDMTSPFQMMSYAAGALDAFEKFVWVYYTTADEELVGASRIGKAQDNLRGVLYTYKKNSTNKNLPTEVKIYKRSESNQWILEDTSYGNYTVTKRPYWAYGLKHSEGGFTDPYLFDQPKNEPGLSYIQPNYENGVLKGMWVIDYYIKFISQYLSNLKIGKSGEIYVITDDGTLVATSTDENVIDERNQIVKNLHRTYATKKDLDEREKILINTWEYLQSFDIASPDFISIRFEFSEYLGYIQSFPNDSKIPWNVLTIVPKSDFFGPIVRDIWKSTALAVGLCVICAGIAALFFGHISKRLKEIAEEMHKVGSFELSKERFSDKPSLVREVNMMSQAIDRMKIGLSSFAKYVPIDLVSELIRTGNPARLGGKKTDMTVLFCDLANFTQLSEKETPDELVKVLSNYLSEMTKVIQSKQGTVDKYLGDAIMAFWGAPLPLENHALYACRAALFMQEKVKILWRNFKEEHGILLSLRIGINSGDMIVGNFGSTARMDYTAIGDPVNLANRLEGLNKFYGTQILIGEETSHLVSDEFLLRPIDHVVVKGRQNAVLVYELIGEKNDISPEVAQGVQEYTNALNLFFNRNFSQAIEKFEKANLLLGGKDLPSQFFINKSKEYVNNPPPEDWKGTTIMTFK